MIISLKKQSEVSCRELFHQIKSIEEHDECIVSDTMEDVGQIVSSEVQICLKSKDITERGVSIGAEAHITVLYITEDRRRVECLHLCSDLSADFDVPIISSDAALQVSLVSQGVQARAVNPRKIAVQIAVRAEIFCWAEDRLEIPSQADESVPEGLQLRLGSEECVLSAQISEKRFVVSEQLSLGAEVEPTKIISARAELNYLDHQIIANKALIKGSAQLRIGYKTEIGTAPSFYETAVPFSVLLDSDDENCLLGRVVTAVTDIYTDLSDTINGSRVLNLELHGVIQAEIQRKEKLTFLLDAYDTRCPLTTTESRTTVVLSESRDTLTTETEERIQASEEMGTFVCAYGEILSFSSKEAAASASAAIHVLLRSEEEGYIAQTRIVNFTTPLRGPDVTVSGARISGIKTRREGSEIVIEATAELFCECRKSSEIRYLSVIETDDDKPFDLSGIPSLTVVKKTGKSLWDLAKRYHSSEAAIEKLNEKMSSESDLIMIPRV